MVGDESLARCLHRRVDDGLQCIELVGLAEHQRGQRIAIDYAVADAARKALSNRGHERAAGPLQAPHFGIGIEQRHAGPLKHPGDGRLAHANRAGECDLDHAAITARSRSAPSNGSSGIPRIVKWSPWMLLNNCTPGPSMRNTPTQ